MKIGELAQKTGTQVETIRFYEREGLLPEPARSSGNYRTYEEAHAQRLAFIRHCRSLDIALDEIRVLLRFIDAPSKNCDQVNSLLDTHIEYVSHRIRELRALEQDLKGLRRLCHEGQAARDCLILGELTHAAQRPPADLSNARHTAPARNRGK